MGVLQDEVVGDIGAAPFCATCGSERVVIDAWACWNRQTGLWELETTFDQAFCQACEKETTLRWRRPKDDVPNLRIRELNDVFRRHGQGVGTVVVTRGIMAQGEAVVREIVQRVRQHDDFSDETDPWGEHDFGTFEHRGEGIIWKIDYLDPERTEGSRNPANPALTHRVLTIMLRSEY